LIVVGNHAPELSSVNEANRRRFSVIPFNFKPEKVDQKLADKLRDEYRAILWWMIIGARDWYQHGLGELPQSVAGETQDYFEENDLVQAWIDECCYLGLNYSDTSANLFSSYVKLVKARSRGTGHAKRADPHPAQAAWLQKRPHKPDPQTHRNRGKG
jgi:putative DNA primase/helicase